MQSIDAFMHVNPFLAEKALAMVFNPTDTTLKQNLTLPLYYTGLEDEALVSEQEGQGQRMKLGRDYSIEVEIALNARSLTWFLIK